MTSPPATLAIWHGYLLGATGSNIYTHHLVDSWVRAGHDVVLACQEPDPTKHPRIHEVVRLRHDRASGEMGVAARELVHEQVAGHGRCTMVVPDVHGLLPVYVLDRYEGYEVVRVPGMDPARLAGYLADHAAAMRWVLDEHSPAGVLVNHAAPLPAALEPVLVEAGVPYAVKVHGSELEYALAEDASLVAPARAALERASAVLVGSDHIAARTRELLGDEAIAGRTHVVPPGVDLDRFRPIARDLPSRERARTRLVDELERRVASDAGGRTRDASAVVRELVERVGTDPARAAVLVEQLASIHSSYEERHVERTAIDAARAIELDADALLVYVGKLIPQKGVHLLLAALPDVLEQHPRAQLMVAGFGPLRDGLEALLQAMVLGDEAALDALADRMGGLSGEGAEQLPHLRGWLDLLRERGELAAWLERAARHRVDEHVSWLGLVDHGVLAELWPLAEASVVPSVLAEAFGMVAAEAAACGCVPVVADHSGLADAAAVIRRAGVEPVCFAIEEPLGTAIGHLAAALVQRLDLDAAERARQSQQARANVAAEWGWDHLAAQVAALMTAAVR